MARPGLHARIKAVGIVAVCQYLGFVPIVALLGLLSLLQAPSPAPLWFVLILIPPYLGARIARRALPAAAWLRPLALTLGAVGGHLLGVWAAQDLLDDLPALCFEMLGGVGGTLLATFLPPAARYEPERRFSYGIRCRHSFPPLPARQTV